MNNNNKCPPLRPAGRIAGILVLVFAAGCAPVPDGSHQSTSVARGPDGSRQATSSPPGSDAATNVPPRETERKIAVPGEFLVRFRPTAGSARVSKLLQDNLLRTTRTFRSVPGLQLVRAGRASDAMALSKALARDTAVEYIEPNFVVHSNVHPDDPHYPWQWGLNNTGQTGGSSPHFPDIDAEAAWDITTGDDNVVVAVVDSGVDYAHEDLAANIWSNPSECDADGMDDDGNGFVDDCHGIDTADDDSDPMDADGHGTHVAGTIGAIGNNSLGVAGVAWRVKILPCRFLDSDGYGTAADAIACLDYLALMKDRGVNIVASNHSWGGEEFSRALEDAIAAQRARGMLIVAAAGNLGRDTDVQPEYPCSYDAPNVLCVAATYEAATAFSNFGYSGVHLGAPGVGIWSTLPNNAYDASDGTSMAAPHVTGALVLLKAQDMTRDWRALRNLVIAGAVPPLEYSIRSVSGGRLNLLNSLTCSNSVVKERLAPTAFETLDRPVGATIVLRALHINCGAPNGDMFVTETVTGQLIPLRDDGVAPDQEAGDGVYSGQWTTTSTGTFYLAFPTSRNNTVTVRVDEMIEAGFPVRTNTRNSFDDPPGATEAALAVGNIDADPDLEIITSVAHFGPVFALNPDGSMLPGFPIWHNFLTRGITLGQFDSNPSDLEVLSDNRLGGIALYDGDGTTLPFSLQGGRLSWEPPPAADADGDGVDEVLMVPLVRADGTHFRSDIVVPSSDPSGPNEFSIGDLNADGVPDFVTANASSTFSGLYASDKDGSLVHFPSLFPTSPNFPWFTSAPYLLIGDVDGDGAPNIVLSGYWRVDSASLQRRIRVHSHRGELLHHFDVDSGSLFTSLADMNGDGIPEIIGTTERQVHVWTGAGTPLPGWPVEVANSGFIGARQPVVGDVDGDGGPDIVVAGSHDGGRVLHAIRHDGTPVAGFPKPFQFAGGALNTPAIADIDNDGRNEIVVAATTGNGLRESIFVYDTRGAGPYGAIEWPQFMGGPRRHGYYETGKNLPSHAYVATQVYGAGNIRSSDGGIDCGADCIQQYTKGSNVVLTATAGSGATFAGWRGACAPQGNPCTLAVNRFSETSADFTSPLTVELAGSGSGSVTSDQPGINCPADCTDTFAARTRVLLTAVAPAGNAFVGWEGACTGSETTCTVLIDDAKTAIARFTDRFPLTVTRTGDGAATVTSNPPGLDCAGDCTVDFTPASTVRLIITPAEDSYLNSITGVPCNIFVPCDVTMNGPQSAQIDVRLKPVISVTITGSGSVQIRDTQDVIADCIASCDTPVPPGLVQVNAVPAAGWRFLRWEGECTGSLGFCSMFADDDLALTAVFEREPMLTVDFSGTGAGTVTSTGGLACGADCESLINPVPQNMTLTATAAAGSTFSGWSGPCSGAAPTCQFAFDTATTVGVTFAANPPPGNGGSSSGGASSSGGKGGGGAQTVWELLVLGLALALTRRIRCDLLSDRRRPPRRVAPTMSTSR